MVFFIFIQFFIEFLQANSGDPDKTPHTVAFDLGPHFMLMSHKKDGRLI